MSILYFCWKNVDTLFISDEYCSYFCIKSRLLLKSALIDTRPHCWPAWPNNILTAKVLLKKSVTIMYNTKIELVLQTEWKITFMSMIFAMFLMNERFLSIFN